jgi:hypothetical protein
MKIINFFKKILLKRKIKLDDKFQYVVNDKFLWDNKSKKVIDNYTMSEFLIMLSNEIKDNMCHIKHAETETFLLTKDFTYKNFIDKYCFHHLVFYLYGNNIFHPTNPKDDILKYYSWKAEYENFNGKFIRVYVEENAREKRKLKLEKINKEFKIIKKKQINEKKRSRT